MFIKSHIKTVTFSLLIFTILLSAGCKKDEEVIIDPLPPTVTAGSATVIGQTWASLRGVVDANGISTSVTFEYDTTLSFENNLKSETQTVDSEEPVIVTTNIEGLLGTKMYYYRIIAENTEGTVTSSDTNFTTLDIIDKLLAFNTQLSYGSVEDIDGNTYKTIDIGSQTWMAENLRTTSLNNGSAIPLIESASEWKELDTLAYSWFQTDSAVYGTLYNWYAVNTELLCPVGWSVPTDDDWNTLVDYLGGEESAGKLLKEGGSRHWLYTNPDITNESGFTALPGGYRNNYGTFGSLYSSGYFWTSTQGDASNTAFYRSMYYGYSNVDKGISSYKTGFSVRCIKDPVTK